MERKLEMVYREGKGKITLDLDMFFPCTQRDFKKVLDIVDMTDDIEVHTSILYDCLSEKIEFIRSVINGKCVECYEFQDAGKILNDPNGYGKKYADLCKILCERYGLPEIDCEFVVKLKKSEFYTRIINEEERFVKKSGWRFSKSGREFEVYKQENCNVYHILIADTGIGIGEAYRKKDIPSIVTKEILDQLNEKKEMIDEARKDYRQKMIALGEWEKDEKPGKDTAEKKTSAGKKSDTHGGKEKFRKSENKNENKNESEEKTMKKFRDVKSFEDLKQQYRELLKANHPDNGGDVETMKEINIQYDALFKIWKDRHEKETGEIVKETAESTRMNFYTDFGWAGENYDGNLTLKEIAKIVRAYVKEKYPLDKFSVRCSYASMCQELHVDIKEFNGKMYLKGDELPKEGVNLKGEDCFDYNYGSTIYASFKKMRENGYFKFDSWRDSDFIKAYDEVMRDPARRKYYGTMSEELRAVIDDVNSFVKSYNYEDCDGMQDYFDVNFWFFGVGVSDCVEVSKTRRINDKKEKFPAKTKKSENTSKTESKKNTAAEKENDTPGAIENLGREPKKSEKSFVIDADYIENLTKEKEKVDISKKETTTEAEQTAESAGDMFAELAKAYITGKQGPAKKKEKKEEKKPEPVKEEQPKEEKKPEKVGYGYKDFSSMFSVEELEKMECGEIVEIAGKYGSDYFFSVNHGEYRLVYQTYNAGTDAKYTGFIINHKFYSDKKAISAEIKKDINTELKKIIPDEEAARKNAGELEECQKRTIDAYLKSDFLEQARGCFYEGKEPDLVLYAPYKDFSVQDTINYILNPVKFVEDCAREYAYSYNRVEIYERYIQYNHTKESLDKIKADKTRTEHKIKKIIDSISEKEKTVKIELSNGNTIKVEACGVRYMKSGGYISEYRVAACDRQYLEHDERGRAQDIQVDDIKQITHGQRVLYRAA